MIMEDVLPMTAPPYNFLHGALDNYDFSSGLCLEAAFRIYKYPQIKGSIPKPTEEDTVNFSLSHLVRFAKNW